MSAKPKAPPKQWSTAEIGRLARLAKKGADAFEASEILGRHVASVRKMAREMKLVLRKRAKRRLQSSQHNHLFERADRAIAESFQLVNDLNRSILKARHIGQQLTANFGLYRTISMNEI